MTLKHGFVLLFAFLFHGFGWGQAVQDSIILLNGKVYRGSITQTGPEFLTFSETTKKGNAVSSEMGNYRIFSYTQNGQETVLYRQNETIGNFLSTEETRNVTLGSYDARQTFKARFPFWSAVVLSYTASVFDTYLTQSAIDNPDYIGSHTSPGLFKKSPTLLPVLVPAVLTVAWSFPSFRIKEHQMIQKDLINNANYYNGFHRIAKQKRMLSSLKGGLIGIGLGLVTYAVLR